MPSFQKSAVFFNIVQTGGGGKPMFKNFVGNCRSFWRSFNNMKFAWKGTFEALMVKFGGKIGTLYQIFTPCTPCKIGQMFKRKGGGQRPFEQCSKKLHFSLGMASLIQGHAKFSPKECNCGVYLSLAIATLKDWRRLFSVLLNTSVMMVMEVFCHIQGHPYFSPEKVN